MKIRGTAMHIAEKYQQLARDAQASGDRVMFENYNQHAEHYQRILAAAQPQQPAAQQPARTDTEESHDPAATNGSGAASANGADQAPEKIASDGDLVDADSPQPFIEDMPVIDEEGKVNGAGQKAGSDDTEADDKPRRRTRSPRARAPRREASEGMSEDSVSAASETTPNVGEAAQEDQPKQRRRTARPRRAKTTDEASSEVSTATD